MQTCLDMPGLKQLERAYSDEKPRSLWKEFSVKFYLNMPEVTRRSLTVILVEMK